MANFSIQSGMSQGEIVGAINYLLANIGLGLQINELTGQISIPRNTVPFAYAYRYAYFAFANSSDGVQGFSQDPATGYTYYGVWNTPNLTPGGSTNPADYVWYKVAQSASPPLYSFYYAVINPYQLEVFSNNAGSRVYLNPPAVGQDLTISTNPLLTFSGTGYIPQGDGLGGWNFIPPGPLDSVLTSNGSTSTWLSIGQVTAVGGANADNILVNNTTPDVYYYPAMVDTLGTYTSINADIDLAFYNTSTGNVLYTPNLETTGTITLLPLAAAPTTFTTGTVAMANAVNWDPAAYSATTPYLTVYNGTNWIALG